MAALITLAGAAQADEEQAAAPQPAAAAVAEKPAAPVAAAEPAAEQQSAAVAADDEKPFKPPKGYKLRRDRGENVYCTKMTVLGSRFAKEDCRTVAELRQWEMQKASMHVEMEQQKHVCASAAGCANP